MAETLTLTPYQTEGPFYPDKMPLDTDNDLIILNDSLTPAVGNIAYLSGQVSDIKGVPIRNALVEIWQVDNNRSIFTPKEVHELNWIQFPRLWTISYRLQRKILFRTQKPSPYSGRTPHIHMAISAAGKRKLTTQCYVKGEPRNQKDFLLKRVKDPNARESLMVPFEPINGSKIGETSARFDIVLGWTPQD